MTAVDAQQLAERYVTAVDTFIEHMRALPAELTDYRATDDSWSSRDIAFHVADVDQLLGLRLRQILADDYPDLAAINTKANVVRYRVIHADRGLALDALAVTGAMNAALVETLTSEQAARKGHHPHGHDVTAGDIAKFFSLHVEAHVKQIDRIHQNARK